MTHHIVPDTLSSFLQSLEGKNRSLATVAAYRTDLTQFFLWLSENSVAATSPKRIVRA